MFFMVVFSDTYIIVDLALAMKCDVFLYIQKEIIQVFPSLADLEKRWIWKLRRWETRKNRYIPSCGTHDGL